MSRPRKELSTEFDEWIEEQARSRDMTPDALREELGVTGDRRPEPTAQVLYAWWDPSMCYRIPEGHTPPEGERYAVLQVGLRVYNSGQRRYLGERFEAEVRVGDQQRRLEHSGPLPRFIEPPPEVRPGVQPGAHGYNVNPRVGALVGPDDVLDAPPDGFVEATLNFRSAPALPLQLSGQSAEFRLWVTDRHGLPLEVSGQAVPVVFGIRQVR